MKRTIAVVSAASLCMLLTGCRAQGASGFGWVAVLGVVLGVICLVVAGLKTYGYVQYVKRRRREGRTVGRKLNVVTYALYVIGVATILAACVVSCSSSTPPAADPVDPSAEATVTTTTTAATVETPTWMTFPADRELTAEQYFVYSCNDKAFQVMKGDENEVVYPASITKLFTAYIAMQHLEPTDTIVVGDALDFVVEGSSVAHLKKGDELTVDMLVEAMLLPSGNDAAYVLAVEVGRMLGGADMAADKAAERFVQEMNTKATELGMTNSHFANPDGIHADDHYMTYHDLSILGTLALDNATICKYATVAIDEVTFENGHTVSWMNTNELVHPGSVYYCPYAKGLKTGQTPYAGSCLLSAFEYGGDKLLIGVFGCPEKEDRFADTLQLFNETL